MAKAGAGFLPPLATLELKPRPERSVRWRSESCRKPGSQRTAVNCAHFMNMSCYGFYDRVKHHAGPVSHLRLGPQVKGDAALAAHQGFGVWTPPCYPGPPDSASLQGKSRGPRAETAPRGWMARKQSSPANLWTHGSFPRQAFLLRPRRFSREGGTCPCAPQRSRRVVDGQPAPTGRTGHAWAAQGCRGPACAQSPLCFTSFLKTGLSGLGERKCSETPGPCPPPPQQGRRSPSVELVRGARTPTHLPRVEAEGPAVASGVQVANWPRFLGPPPAPQPFRARSWGAVALMGCKEALLPRGLLPHWPRPSALLQGTRPFTFPSSGSFSRR